MNKEQREQLQKAIDIISEIAEQEQEKYDNAPENLQDTERVEKFQEDADSLEEIRQELESILEGC